MSQTNVIWNKWQMNFREDYSCHAWIWKEVVGALLNSHDIITKKKMGLRPIHPRKTKVFLGTPPVKKKSWTRMQVMNCLAPYNNLCLGALVKNRNFFNFYSIPCGEFLILTWPLEIAHFYLTFLTVLKWIY